MAWWPVTISWQPRDSRKAQLSSMERKNLVTLTVGHFLTELGKVIRLTYWACPQTPAILSPHPEGLHYRSLLPSDQVSPAPCQPSPIKVLQKRILKPCLKPKAKCGQAPTPALLSSASIPVIIFLKYHPKASEVKAWPSTAISYHWEVAVQWVLP